MVHPSGPGQGLWLHGVPHLFSMPQEYQTCTCARWAGKVSAAARGYSKDCLTCDESANDSSQMHLMALDMLLQRNASSSVCLARPQPLLCRQRWSARQACGQLNARLDPLT